MKLWTIVPVKPWNLAKSRLDPLFSRAQREALAAAMLHHVLDVLTTAPVKLGVLVVSRDTRALAEARDYGVQTVLESGSPALNPALTRAAQLTRTMGATSTLVLPADLPLFSVEDLEALVNLACQSERAVVLASDRHGDGTNALLTCPPGVIEYAFGPGSFSRHKALAEKAQADVYEWHSPRVALDIDTPDDLACYRALAEELGEPLIMPELLALAADC